MTAPFHVLLLTIIIVSHISSSSSSSSSLTRGSSLSAEHKDDLLVSRNGLFMAGFHRVGANAYCFAVWFSEQAIGTRTVVWMANRDEPVNGKHSKLSLWKHGNLVLIDAGQHIIWSTQTEANSSSVQLQLLNDGNLVLLDENHLLWQSFDHPTDTLLPNQIFTKNKQLVASRSSANYSSGYYKLFFDNDSILKLLYESPETTSIYWPDPRKQPWSIGRFQYIESRSASLDSRGQFNSSDAFSFFSADFGIQRHRFMRIDTDGNVRAYSLVEREGRMNWEVQWQAINRICRIDGTCGPNSLCTYSRDSPGRKCSCLHGYKMVNSKDWKYGCEPKFKKCKQDDCGFIELRNAEFYGYDTRMNRNYSLDACKMDCLQDDNCTGFQLGWKSDKGFYCFMKSSLHNGYLMGINTEIGTGLNTNDVGLMYIKLPKTLVSSFGQKNVIRSNFTCPAAEMSPIIIRSYEKKHDINNQFGLLIVFGCTIGFIEIICILFFWYCSSKRMSTAEQSYFPAATEFRRFTYSELKKATRNFKEEIGSGGASIVYKGKLSDNRIAAIKRLKTSNLHGEEEFQAEISTIGRVNHMNLIETWGYCTEGKHRLVVYEFMEKGSLAENLRLGKLDWPTRFNIAVGTAKGLAYLHEECLEWVLHCDVKPHNILLDAYNNPKVADFGLSKLLDRDGLDQTNHFSMMRGTRGYMAPEWVLNLLITSKVDVFSYGVVILEMITGRSPASLHQTSNIEIGETEVGLIEWVRDRIDGTESWVEEVVDPSISEYDERTMENLVRIALKCVEEDRESRPSMSQVVDMLLHV